MENEKLFNEVNKVLNDLNMQFNINKEALLPDFEQNVEFPDGTIKNAYVVPYVIPIPSLIDGSIIENRMFFAYLDEKDLKVVFLMGATSLITIGYDEDGKAFKVSS